MIYGLLTVLGLCFGSFTNALVWRLHKQASSSKKGAYSISRGRSMCPHCKHQLQALDLIPIVSWVALRGRCRYCGKPIPDTPLPELLLPLLYLFSYLYWPLKFYGEGITLFIFWLLFLVGFMALALYDYKWQMLPNRVLFPLAGLALLELCLQLVLFKGGLHVALGAVSGVLTGGGIFWILFQLSGGTWIGGGDVKLGALLGLILGGVTRSLLMIFGASLLGTLIMLPLLGQGKAKKTTRVPFGPFLIISAIILQLFGMSLISWYKRTAGL